MKHSTRPFQQQRILCYAPYNIWKLHGMWEMTILHTLKLRGADFRYVMCDGVFTECDIFWKATNPRHAASCTLCKNQTDEFARNMGIPFQWIGQYLNADDFNSAAAWVESLSIDDYMTAEYENWQIGVWVKGSVNSHFRMSELDINAPEIKQVYEHYLYSGLIACIGINRLLDDYCPDTLFLFNGRMSSTQVALSLARQKGIRTITHERGYLKESILLIENGNCLDLRPIKQIWNDWGAVPLSQNELHQITSYLLDREHGQNLSWRPFSPKPQPLPLVRQLLKIPDQCPVWVLFTSSDDEIISADGWEGVFSSQHEWISRTVNYIKNHPDIRLIVRIHPNTSGKYATGNNFQQLKALEILATQSSDNISFIMPEDNISSYSLMEIANIGLVYQSTVGIEMACKGKVISVASGSMISDLPFVNTIKSVDGYENILDGYLKLAFDYKSATVARMAYRYAYGIFFRYNISFPLVGMPDPHNGVLKYTSIQELLPNKDPSLDRIARIVLDKEQVCRPPEENEKNRSSEDEDAWFARQTHENIPVVLDHISNSAMSNSPLVSVIIPCYNYAHYLSEAVTSVINQTLQDFEIIIVNDGSTDNTREVAESLIHKYTSHTITLINQQNSGQPAISRNNGISASRGLFIFCLDADDMIEPAMIEECLRLLESHPEIAIAYTDRLDFDGAEGVVQAGEYDFSRLIHANHISYCALYRREVWERVGGYRENVKAVEDWDFWIAAGALGYYGKRIPLPLFKYRRHDTGIFQEALKDFYRKHAQVIINNAALYDPALIAQAEKMLGTAVSASPLVSVIVPTFNRPDMLKDAIQSILDQAFQNFEIIVVNDAGQDVLFVIQTFNSLKISYLSHETNKGLAAARNTGISAARGKYIAYLDDDDIYYPEHLATLVQRLESDGSFVAYSDAHRVHLEDRDGVATVIGRDIPYSMDFDCLRILFENFIPVLCVMHRRECLEQAGGFDPLLHRLEDWDLWIRMSRHYQFNHVPTVTCAFSWRTSGGATMTSANWEAFDWARLRVSHKSRPLLPQIPAAAAWQAEFVDAASQRLIMALDSVLAARHYEPRALFGTDDLDEVRSSASRLRDQHPEHQVQMARLRERIENYAHLAPENGPGALQGGGRQEANPAPLVSVIVPTFNRPETLRVALESILNQSFTDFEIVVVNDAGSEVDFVLEALPHQVKIVYLRHQMNRGLAAARNTGIGAARGKYIAYLDDDDIFYPDHLETLVHLLQAHQHQVAYTDAYRALQRPEQWIYRTFEKEVLYSCDFDYQRMLVENFIPVLCIMHEKSCLLKSGLFDESLKRHEDWDLWIRMSRHFRFVHLPKVTCEFTFRTDGSGMTSGTLPTFLESMRYVYQKYAQEVASDLVLRQRQKHALMQLNLKIFIFLGDRLAPFESLASIPFHELEQTGATQAQIRSAFHYLQGKKNDDTHETVLLLERALAECPDNHQACLDLVSLYLNAGSYTLAAARLNLLEEANPGEKTFAELRVLLQEKFAASGYLLVPSELVQLSPEKASRQGIEVSVVIPVFNQATYTRACLETLFAVTGEEIMFEVIVVDNASSDWTPEFLKSQVPRIRVISNDRNLGFAKACNQGAQIAKGEYLLFLNNDTVPQPGWLDALLSGIHEEEADIVGAKLLYPNGKVQHAGVAFNRNGIGYHIFKNFDADTPAVNKKRFMQCVTAACMLVSKQLYSELGGFEEQFRNGFEDVDFCLRAGQDGKRILYNPNAVLIHHEEQSEGRKQHDRENMQCYLARWQGFVHSDDEELYTAEGFSVEWHADGTCVVRPRSVQQVIHESSRYPLIPLVGHSSSSILQKLSSSQRTKGVLKRYTSEE